MGEKYDLILNDENWFLYGGDSYPGNDCYYTDDKDKCLYIVRFEGEAKFPTKNLVWITISESGSFFGKS